MTAISSYDRDFYAWATEQAALLRFGRPADADIAHIAEEIDSMGRSERRELVNRMDVQLTHLLTWQFQPAFRGNSWKLTIREQRRKIARHVQDNPSLAGSLDAAIADAYGDALLSAQKETGLGEDAFPASCPDATADIFADDLLPQ